MLFLIYKIGGYVGGFLFHVRNHEISPVRCLLSIFDAGCLVRYSGNIADKLIIFYFCLLFALYFLWFLVFRFGGLAGEFWFRVRNHDNPIVISIWCSMFAVLFVILKNHFDVFLFCGNIAEKSQLHLNVVKIYQCPVIDFLAFVI